MTTGAGIGAVHNWVKAYHESGMAALQVRNRNAAQNGKTAPAPRRSRNAGDGNDDAEALRRRIEELEPRNALMREVVEVRRKDLGTDPRRLSNREKTLPSDRMHPTYSLNSMRIGILREDNAGKHSCSPNLLPYFWQNACIGECTSESQEDQYQWLLHRGPNSSRRFLTGNSTFHQEKKYQSEGSPSTQDIIRRMRSNNFNQTDVEQFYMAFIKDFVFCRSALKKFSQKISIAFAAASIK